MGEHRDEVGDRAVTDLAANPWDKAYWFARMLIASDQYGAPGKNSEAMIQVAESLRSLLQAQKRGEESELAHDAVAVIERLLVPERRNTRIHAQRRAFCDAAATEIATRQDIEVFALVCDKLMVPINEALRLIPSDDTLYAQTVAKTLLDRKHEGALAQVIEVWDDLGTRGCIRVERARIVEGFRTLRYYLADHIDNDDADIVLTAFAQEFERRVAQKRKGRAGRSLESVTAFVLDYFDIPSAPAPEHFTTGLEIDNWVADPHGWLVGISCKRTLRERWKQAYTTDVDLLNRHRIKMLWHVLTYTRDLSDAKITEMGSYKARLFLPEDTELYARVSQHPGMSHYVRALSDFIPALRAHVRGEHH